jgi:transposase-like protein
MSRYTLEFKRQMVAFARAWRTAASLLKEFGCSAMAIGPWIKRAARAAATGTGFVALIFMYNLIW